MKLLFVTHNQHKAQEISDIFKSSGLPLEINTLMDLGDYEPIEENGDTLLENALAKAREGHRRHQTNCFADDTGLEVETLDGRPGVYSARYAGMDCSPQNNMDKLLNELQDKTNRKARFRTVIALILDREEFIFEGEVSGQIVESRRGTDGFGYDPIFLPNGYTQTFAEMSEAEKNRISHRGLAIESLITFLKRR